MTCHLGSWHSARSISKLALEFPAFDRVPKVSRYLRLQTPVLLCMQRPEDQLSGFQTDGELQTDTWTEAARGAAQRLYGQNLVTLVTKPNAFASQHPACLRCPHPSVVPDPELRMARRVLGVPTGASASFPRPRPSTSSRHPAHGSGPVARSVRISDLGGSRTHPVTVRRPQRPKSAGDHGLCTG